MKIFFGFLPSTLNSLQRLISFILFCLMKVIQDRMVNEGLQLNRVVAVGPRGINSYIFTCMYTRIQNRMNRMMSIYLDYCSLQHQYSFYMLENGHTPSYPHAVRTNRSRMTSHTPGIPSSRYPYIVCHILE